MANEVSTKFYEVLQTHLDTGVPVSDLDLCDRDKRRMLVCLDAYKWLDAHPFANVNVFLRNKHGRSIAELKRDVEVVNFLIAQMNSDTKAMSRYRALKATEKAMAASDAMGDMRTLLDGAKTLIKLESLDKPESMLEDLSKSVHALPPVFTTDVTKINSDLTNITSEQKEKLLRKYNVQKDKTQEMVEAKMGFFVPAGSTVPYEEYEEVDEENMFDQYDDDAL